jgi:hypothetical protein
MVNLSAKLLTFTFSFLFQNKDGAGDSSFPILKDQTQFSVSHARYSKVMSLIFIWFLDKMLICYFYHVFWSCLL